MNSSPAIFADSQEEHRRQSRTHIFVAAVLYSGNGSSPIHIRNLSTSGVLIEAGVIPEPGTRVVLKRGSLEAAGTVAWRHDRRAGVAFDATIQVSDWISRKTGSHQDRVDRMLVQARAEHQAAHLPTIVPGSSAITFSLESELLLLRADLEKMGAALIEDPALVAAHPEIQLLDLSVQRVDRLLARLKQAA